MEGNARHEKGQTFGMLKAALRAKTLCRINRGASKTKKISRILKRNRQRAALNP